ncbi:MAG: thioesterase family protein [Planctomycetota bacterium]
MPAFTTPVKVRFSDIDHAGIVYYPRIIHYFHLAFEEFFGECAGTHYARVLDEWKVGFPAVAANVEFKNPLAYGDTVDVEVTIDRIGGSSLVTRYRVRKRGSAELVAEGTVTTVTVDMDSFRPCPLPDRLREVFARYPTDA